MICDDCIHRTVCAKVYSDDWCAFKQTTETINAIIIPDNATNGDMIKTMFHIRKEIFTDYGTIKVYGLDDEKTPNEFLVEWWNVPYKLSKSKGESE